MLAARRLVLSLLLPILAADRQDANEFFDEFDGLPTALPSFHPEAKSVQEQLRLKNFGRRWPASPDSRRSSKPGLFPQLQRKPNPDDELLKSNSELYVEPRSYHLSPESERAVTFTDDNNDKITGISVEKFLSSHDDIIGRKRGPARHRLDPGYSSHETTTQGSIERFHNEKHIIPRNHELQRFRQRLILGSPPERKEKIDARSREVNRDTNFVPSSSEKVGSRNQKVESKSQEALRLRSEETFLTDKEDSLILNPEIKQRSGETITNEFVNQRNPPTNVARSSKVSAETFLTDKESPNFLSNENFKAQSQPRQKTANHEKVRETTVKNRNDQNQNSRSQIQNRENMGRLSAETFLTDKEDQYFLSDQNLNPRTQSRQNQVKPEGAVTGSGSTALSNRNDLKQNSRSQNENRKMVNIERSSKGSSETFLTDKDDPFLDHDYVLKLRDKTINRPVNQMKSTVRSGETFLTDEDDKNYFPPKQQSSRENSLQRSYETFLTVKEELPGQFSPKSRPLVPRRRPSNDRRPQMSSETFLTDADDPPELRRQKSRRPVHPGFTRDQDSSTPSSDESFLTDQGTLPPKKGRFRPETSSPPSSNENSIIDSDNFLRGNDPNPIPPPQAGTGPPKYLGRVRWPPPKSAESDESSAHHQLRFKPLFYEDIKPQEQFGSEENRNDHHSRRKGFVNKVQDESREDYQEVNKRPVADDDGRPPIYDDHHPFLEFEDSNEKTIPSSHGSAHPVDKSERNHEKHDEEVRGNENEGNDDHTSKEEDEPFPGDGEEDPEEDQEESPISELDSEESPHPEHHESQETPHREYNNHESEDSPHPSHSHEELPEAPEHSNEEHPNHEESHEEHLHPPPNQSHEEHSQPNPNQSHEEEHPAPPHQSQEEEHQHPSPNQSHEEHPHPPPNQSHEEHPYPPPNQSHEEHPPPPHHSQEEEPFTNNVDSHEQHTDGLVPGGHPSTSDEEGGELGHEEEERPPPDYDERPPDYDSIRPTPEYEDGGSHSGEDGTSSEGGQEQGSSEEHQEEPDYGPGPSEEEQEPDYPQGPPRKNKKGRPSPDYDGGPNAVSGEEGGEGNASPEFNFDSFEFPDDVMEPPPSSVNFGSTTRRPGVTRRPTSLPDDCPDGDEATSQPPFDLLKAKRPTNTVRPLPRPGDEVSITVAGPSAVKVPRPQNGPTSPGTRRPFTISALGVVKPGGEIIAKVVQAGSSTTTRGTSTTSRPSGTLRSARLRPASQWGNKVKSKERVTSTTTASPSVDEPWKNLLAAREATALTYLKPPPIGQPQTWLQTAPPPSQMFRLFVV